MKEHRRWVPNRRLIPLILLLSPACSGNETPSDVLPCNGTEALQPGYADKSLVDLDADWFYRRTFYGSGSSLDGAAKLDLVRFTLTENELAAFSTPNNERLSAWTVTDHFDIVTCTDASGVAARYVNRERPWAERRFMRVDWSTGQVSGANLAPEVPGWTATLALTGVAGNLGNAPNLPRFEADYLEATETASVQLDAATCAQMPNAADCTATGKIRHSFRTASVARGNYVARQAPATLPFGLSMTAGRALHRTGNEPVIYYLAYDIPESWAPAAAAAAAEYARIRPGFEIRPNECRLDRVQQLLPSEPEVQAELGTVDQTNLERACDLLELATEGAFRWQRPGDLRFNLIVAVHPDRALLWGAHASRAIDADSGQILQATVWIDGSRIEQAANRVAEAASAQGAEARAIMSRGRDRAAQLSAQSASDTFVGTIQARLGAPSNRLTAAEQIARLDRLRGTLLEQGELEDLTFTILFAGPEWNRTGIDPIPERALGVSSPPERIERLLGAERRTTLAKLSGLGFCFLTADVDPHYEGLAFSMDAAGVRERLLTHTILHELGHNFGLTHNYEGSSDALNYEGPISYSSVMDVLAGIDQPLAVLLGSYDVAALRYAYDDQLQIFADGTSLTAAEVREVAYENLGQLGMIEDRAWVASDTATNPVPYAWCTEEVAYLQPTVFCRPGDRGASAREIFAGHYEDWAAYYSHTNVVRGPNFDAYRALEPVIEAFLYASAVAAELDRPGRSFTTDLSRDLVTTSALAANFVSEILGVPQNGPMCAWPGTMPPIYIPEHFVGTACETIEVPKGPGRPLLLPGLDSDGQPWREVGTYFDRQNVLWLLGLVTSGRTALYHLYEPELAPIFTSMIKQAPYMIAAREARDHGSHYCSDGTIEARRIIDPVSGAANPGPSASCGDPALLHPQLPDASLPHALLWAHAFLGAGADLRIYRVGSDDQMIDWTAMPQDAYCAVLSVESGIEYRALAGAPELPCQMIEGARNAQDDMLGSSTNPFYRDRSRRWFAWLDLARSLRDAFIP